MTTAAVDPLIAFTIESWVGLVLWFALLAVKVFALCDAVIRKDALFVAADKHNKAFWLVLLAVFLVAHYIVRDPRSILNLIGTVVAFVYLADVRPTLRSMHSR